VFGLVFEDGLGHPLCKARTAAKKGKGKKQRKLMKK